MSYKMDCSIIGYAYFNREDDLNFKFNEKVGVVSYDYIESTITIKNLKNGCIDTFTSKSVRSIKFYPLAVCLIIQDGDKILGVSRKDDHSDMGLIGGKVDPLESIDEAAIREALEETGYTVELYHGDYFSCICGEFRVYTLRAKIIDIPRKDIDASETGLVKFVDPIELTKGTFGEYNIAALNYFNISY